MFERILVAVDGSEQALQAAKLAGDLARALNSAELRIVFAYDGTPHYVGHFQQILEARLCEANASLNDARAAVGRVQAVVHTELIEGDPAETIINVAVTHGSSVVVLGSHGLNRLLGFVLGSTTQRVASRAPCPVLVVN